MNVLWIEDFGGNSSPMMATTLFSDLARDSAFDDHWHGKDPASEPQDVEDFLANKYGKPIITNSSLQMLLKQSPAAIDIIAKTFNLTEVEQSILLQSDVGTGLFFVGNQHVPIEIVSSYSEEQVITSDPEAILARKNNANN